MKMIKIIILTVLGGILFSSKIMAQTGSVTAQHRSVPYSITISGGVSLGMYEAGLNWALIKFMKENNHNTEEQKRVQAEIKSIAGASAGSINALLTACAWALDDEAAYSDKINDNVFLNTWIDLGIDALLPASEKKYPGTYLPGDALFSRKKMLESVNRIIKTMLSKKIFKAGIKIPIAFMVTREKAGALNISGLTVKNQRFVIPVYLVVEADKSIKFYQYHVNPRDESSGNIIHLQGERQSEKSINHPYFNNYEIELNQIIDAIIASSSFPIVFGKKKLKYCKLNLKVPDSLTDDSLDKCPPGYECQDSFFIDGGIFDNIPLGMSKRMAEPTKNDIFSGEWHDLWKPVNYVYIDPDHRRKKKVYGVNDFGESSGRGLKNQSKFFIDTLTSGRNYELYTELRTGAWQNSVSHHFAMLETSYNQLSGDEQALAIAKKLFNASADSYKAYVKKIKNESSDYLKKNTGNFQHFNYSFSDSPGSGYRRLQQIRKGVKLLEQAYRGADDSVNSRLRQLVTSAMLHFSVTENLYDLIDGLIKMRDDKFGDRKILLTTREGNLTGEQLYAFAAFLHGEFRFYDYYVGVYDAVYNLTQYTRGVEINKVGRNENFKKTFLTIKNLLGVPQDEKANFIFSILEKEEFGGFEKTTDVTRFKHLQIIHEALNVANTSEGKKKNELEKFTAFIQYLINRDYKDAYLAHLKNSTDKNERTIAEEKFNDSILNRIMKNPHQWYSEIAIRASRRLLYLEKQTSKEDALVVPLLLSSYALNTSLSKSLYNSTTSGAWNLLPYELAFDTRNGGVVMGWELGWPVPFPGENEMRFVPRFNLFNFPARVVDEHNKYSTLSLNLEYKTEWFLMSSIGAGGMYFFDWEHRTGDDEDYGTNLYVGVFADKFRLTSWWRKNDGNNFYGFNVGITDIPGIVKLSVDSIDIPRIPNPFD